MLLLNQLKNYLSYKPKSMEALHACLASSLSSNLLNQDAFAMIEGVLQVSAMQVRDIMIPKSQIRFITHDMGLSNIIHTVIDSAHSRFPVVAEDKDTVLGILLAKDLLHYTNFEKTKKFSIENLTRQTTFVPESKRLDQLLKEFQLIHRHMAIVVNEYNHLVGLVTIEDILEQIVGEIEDEHDIQTQSELIKPLPDKNTFSLQALTPLDVFNDYFGTDLQAQGCDTLADLLAYKLGRLPKQSEKIECKDFCWIVLKANSRRVKLLKLIYKKD